MSKLLTAASAASAPSEGAELTVERLMEVLRTATEEQRTEMLGLLGASAVPVKKAGTAVAKKTAVPAARKAAVAAPLPEPEEDGAPSAASYRLKEEDIDHAVCVARVLKGGEDKRWKPIIYREFQCGKASEEDCDLCKICQTRLEKYAEEPKPGDWTGRVTEDPPGWLHMLDTEWAASKKPKWMGAGASAPDSDSGSEASSAAASSAAASKVSKAAEKEAAKASKAAEKEAAKAAKEAEKESKAKKVPAPKKAAAAAPAVKKAVGGAGAATPAPAPAKAASAAAAAEVELELKLIDGTIYSVKGKNVYEYDEDAEDEEVGAFVGRLTDDETIDRDAKEAEEEDEE